MSEQDEPFDGWMPLARSDLEHLLQEHASTPLHLLMLYWLIWFSLLPREDLLRLLSLAREAETTSLISKELDEMQERGLIEVVTLKEPARHRERLYYATDLGLYLYLSAVQPSPPLTMSRLVKAYPVGRGDLLARLARPQVHLALSELVSRLITEGEAHGYHLVSYQQPWHHRFLFGGKRHHLHVDAALLLGHLEESQYAFVVYVDIGPHERADRHLEHWLSRLLSLRHHSLLAHTSWPGLLLISTKERQKSWARLLLESSVKRTTKPLAGGITTLAALHEGVYTPIWRDLVKLATADDPDLVPLLPLSALLQEEVTPQLSEQFSHQHQFYEILLKEAALSPARLSSTLLRHVGTSLMQEATLLTGAQLETLFAGKRKTSEHLEGAGLLTLALSAKEKSLLTEASHHPLLDVPTLQVLLSPRADMNAIKPLQATITHLFELHLLETRLWGQGRTPLSQQRYLLTPVALKFTAIRHGEPLSFYFVPPKYHKDPEDEQLDRQWGTRGLAQQMEHTHGLYTFMRQLIGGTTARGEELTSWKSAHEAARWYLDPLSHKPGHARPDAEVLFAPTPEDELQTLLLEYDRGTSTYQLQRKFKAYLDYQQATGILLPTILIVTPTQHSAQRIRQVVDGLSGTLAVAILLERDALAHGLTLVLPRPPVAP